MQAVFFEATSPFEFLFITCVLGGWAAYMTGRACALTWGKMYTAIIYMVPLTFAVRFIHYIPPFNGTLLSLHYYLVDFIILVIFTITGFRYTRTKQMVKQYSWMYKRTSPLTWQKK